LTTPRRTTSTPSTVLAVLLLESRTITEVATVLEPADFRDEVNRTIFEAMLHLHAPGKPHSVRPEQFGLF
jgi:replicative DNA helicase